MPVNAGKLKLVVYISNFLIFSPKNGIIYPFLAEYSDQISAVLFNRRAAFSFYNILSNIIIKLLQVCFTIKIMTVITIDINRLIV